MSNEEVVLQMVVNRLQQLLEMHEELKSRWSAEIEEIIKLGQGVLTAPPQDRTPDGRWLLTLSNAQLEMVNAIMWQENTPQDYPSSEIDPVRHEMDRFYSIMASENANETVPGEPDGDDDPDPIEPIIFPDEGDVPIEAPTYHMGVDLAEPDVAPETRFQIPEIGTIWRSPVVEPDPANPGGVRLIWRDEPQ